MPRQQAGQVLTSSSQHEQAPLDVPRRLRQLLSLEGQDLLRTDQLAAEYQFPSAEAVRKFLRRHDVPFTGRGRIVLVDRRDFVAALKRIRKAS